MNLLSNIKQKELARNLDQIKLKPKEFLIKLRLKTFTKEYWQEQLM